MIAASDISANSPRAIGCASARARRKPCDGRGMHPENQSPSVSASPWPSKSFETDDPDEVIGYLNGQNRSVVRAITPLDKTTKFVFTRKELDLGRVSLVHSTSSPIQIHTINSSVLTVVVSERGNSLFKVGRTEVASRNGDAAIAAATTSGEGIFQSLCEDLRFLLQLPRQHFLAESQAEKGSIVRSFPARIELDTGRCELPSRIELCLAAARFRERAAARCI